MPVLLETRSTSQTVSCGSCCTTSLKVWSPTRRYIGVSIGSSSVSRFEARSAATVKGFITEPGSKSRMKALLTMRSRSRTLLWVLGS